MIRRSSSIRFWRAWNFSMGVLLVALPVAFVAGHVLTAGTTWNHVSSARFSPWTNYVSDYAYRSPVWGLFVGSMYGLAALLGMLSMGIACGPAGSRARAWLCASLLAYAALKMVEVALYPVKPPEITVEEIQSRLDAGSWSRLKEELLRVGISVTGGRPGSGTTARDLVMAYETNANHLLGIRPAMMALFGCMLLTPLIQPRAWKDPLRLGLLAIALVLTASAMPSTGWFGEKVGLAQRLGFCGVYLWLWLAWRVIPMEEPGHPSTPARDAPPGGS